MAVIIDFTDNVSLQHDTFFPMNRQLSLMSNNLQFYCQGSLTLLATITFIDLN